MKKALILAMLALLAVGTAPAWASDFSIFGSYLDTQDLNDTVGGGIKAGFPVGNPNWEIELRGTYLPDLTEDLSSFVNDKPKTSSDITAYPFDAGVKFNFAPESGVNPYLGGGASYYFLSADRGQIDDEAGAYAVGGVELSRASRGTGFFAEAIYRNINAKIRHEPSDFDQADDVNFVGFRNHDLNVGGFGVNAGIIWKF